MTRLLIRADGGPGVGLGHVMRCLALAQAWQAAGGEASFLTALGTPEPLARQSEFPVEQIAVRPGSSEDAELTRDWMTRRDADWLVLDGYDFGPAFQEGVAAHGRQLVVDDTAHQPHYQATILLNQNLDAHRLSYAVDPGTMRLLGPQFALLRREFLRWRGRSDDVPREPRTVLVTMGGADPANATRLVLDGLRLVPSPRLNVRVVVGAANPHRASVEAAASDHPHAVELIDAPVDMSDLMALTDLAVAAAGSTAWELAFMGVPSALVQVAENQRGVLAGVAEVGAALSLGDVRVLDTVGVANAIGHLIADDDARTTMARMGRAVVDGLGARRVAAAMLGRAGSAAPRLRPATAADVCLLWQWTNDPVTRASSFSTATIPWADHRAWFDRKLASPASRIWLLEVDDLAVGVTRVDRDTAGVGLISYAVAPGFRGSGYGTALLRLSAPVAVKELALRELRGVTLAENVASRRAFEKAGFRVGRDDIVQRRASQIFRWAGPARGDE